MSTVLSQSSSASHPDRPKDGGVGLQATMAPGDQGAFISHDTGPPLSYGHLRFTFNHSGMSGGRVVLMACLDAQGTEVLRVSYDSHTRQLIVWTTSGAQVSTFLDGVLPWQCIEVSFDAGTGQLELWINGVPADQMVGDLSAVLVQMCLLGAIQKQTDVTGELHIDEFCISDSYIGPVLVEPMATNAGDPARWLVVYNKSHVDAPAWAETYRQGRDLPFANLLGLTLPGDETITAAEYDLIRLAIQEYLSQTGLDNQIMGILIGYGMPGYVDFQSNGVLEAVPSLLQFNSATAGTVTNPNGASTIENRLGMGDLSSIRMTSRIDGPDLSVANQVIMRATSIMTVGLCAEESALYFDPFVGIEPSYQPAFQQMLNWAIGLGGMQTRLPIMLSGDPAGNEDTDFESVTLDGFFWGWSSTHVSPHIFNSPPGQRAVSAQLYLEGPTATSIRQSEPDNWINVPIEQGYASSIASCRDNSVSSIPDAGRFFDALRSGWTLGEAWHVAQPELRSGFYLVGDPLMTVPMPTEGFEVFGPLQSLEDLDVASPSHVLTSLTQEVDLSGSLPTEGLPQHYVIRRSDDSGRIEASATSLHVVNHSGVLHEALVVPVWPDVESWPVEIENGLMRLSVHWPWRLDVTGIHTIELMQQPTGQALSLASTAAFKPHDRSVVVTLPMPPSTTRYRWRLTSSSGETFYSTTSDWVEPTTMPTKPLQAIGV